MIAGINIEKAILKRDGLFAFMDVSASAFERQVALNLVTFRQTRQDLRIFVKSLQICLKTEGGVLAFVILIPPASFHFERQMRRGIFSDSPSDAHHLRNLKGQS